MASEEVAVPTVEPVAADEPAAGTTKKTSKAKKKNKPKKHNVNHPKYSAMITEALTSLKEKGGSSRQAILKYIVANFNVDTDKRAVNNHIKMSLRAGVKNGMLKQSKGSGASGSFRLGDKAKAMEKLAKKAATPQIKKEKTVKLTKKVKKPKNVTANTEKKALKTKGKKAATKSPAKASPKKSPPKKAPAKKSPAKKSPAKKAAKKTKAAKPKKGSKKSGKKAAAAAAE